MCNVSNNPDYDKQIELHTHDNYMYHASVLGYDVYFHSQDDKEAALDGLISDKESEIDTILRKAGDEMFSCRLNSGTLVENNTRQVLYNTKLIESFDNDIKRVQKLTQQIDVLKAQLPKYTQNKLKQWIPRCK